MSNAPAISVVIVSWNGMRQLPECLAALLPQLPPNAEVILVDNGSADGTASWVRSNYPQIRVIALPNNLGFAGGVNAGLRIARGELLLLINDDAFAEPGFVDALLDVMAQQPEIGAAGGLLLFAHRPEIVASAGIRVRRDWLALDLWAGREAAELPAEPQPILGPSGGAAIYRRALLEDIGLMEASFFNYLEDVDLAWRALLRGWRSVVVPGARARHVYSATAGQGSAFKQRLLGRNRLRVIVRCLPAELAGRCLPTILAYDLLAIVYGVLTRHPAIAAGRLAALRDLPQLIRERLAIQSRRSASADEIMRWIEPAGPPWQTLGEQRRLDALLSERVMPDGG
ncbi:MAG TPA: glycosyltransferase family 2 protein [Roseiflexaceae bacterium]|nr:glycosyltransferase family 2 protein [Roseiflexaceae bacterium]